MKKIFLTASFAAAVMLVAAPAGAQGTASADADHGKQVYMAEACYTCHGTTGAGGGFAGPRLAHIGLTPEIILQQLRRPANVMPAYTDKVLSDGNSADISAYILSLSQGPAPTGKDIPILNR